MLRLTWSEQVSQSSIDNNPEEDDDEAIAIVNQMSLPMNSNIALDPFVTVKNRRRLIKERRQDSNPIPTTTTRFSGNSSNMNNHDRRRYPSIPKQEISRSSPRNSSIQMKTQTTSPTKEDSSNSNPIQEPVPEKTQSSPHLSSHSSTSSLTSLSKRQSKPPPVVFLNKSINVELDDVSFGFDIDSITVTRSSDEINPNSSQILNENKNDLDITDTSTSSTPVTTTPKLPVSSDGITMTQPIENSNERTVPLRTTRDPQFYSGPDIRPHHRTYPTVSMSTGSNYIDPLLLFQYNQARYPTYPSLAYMNLLRTQYLPSQAPYVILPSNAYPTASNAKIDSDVGEKSPEDVNIISSTDPVQEPLLVYTALPNSSGQVYYNSSISKHPLVELKSSVPSMSNIYPTSPAVYPAPVFYPRVPQQPMPGQIFPSPAAYFQPIPSSSLFVETRIDQQDIDHTNHQYTNANKIRSNDEQLPSTSSDIMSSALQLVYSQQRRNAQTDRFNLDDLTAYLAMKWTETVDHYDQGMH